MTDGRPGLSDRLMYVAVGFRRTLGSRRGSVVRLAVSARPSDIYDPVDLLPWGSGQENRQRDWHWSERRWKWVPAGDFERDSSGRCRSFT